MKNEDYIGFFGFLGYKRSYALKVHALLSPFS